MNYKLKDPQVVTLMNELYTEINFLFIDFQMNTALKDISTTENQPQPLFEDEEKQIEPNKFELSDNECVLEENDFLTRSISNYVKI